MTYKITGYGTALVERNECAPLRVTLFPDNDVMISAKNYTENTVFSIDELRAILAAVEELDKQPKTYWEYVLYGEQSDGEYASRDAARAACIDKFSADCWEDKPKHGQQWEEEVEFVEYRWTMDDPAEVKREKEVIELECWNDEIGEVL